MHGLKQMLEFVMNMDYKLQPIADRSDTMTLARVAFAHFFTLSVTNLCFGKHHFEYHCPFIHGLSTWVTFFKMRFLKFAVSCSIVLNRHRKHKCLKTASGVESITDKNVND